MDRLLLFIIASLITTSLSLKCFQQYGDGSNGLAFLTIFTDLVSFFISFFVIKSYLHSLEPAPVTCVWYGTAAALSLLRFVFYTLYN